MSDYDTDILIWSERQAELLRRRAVGELINEADLDWSNIAEEVESVGRSQLSTGAVAATRQALIARAEGRGVAIVSGSSPLAGRGAPVS